MKKVEYIEKYGQEKWDERMRKKRGKYKKKEHNDVSFKVTIPISPMPSITENYTEYMECLEEFAKLTSRLQKRLRGWWGTITEKDFILVVTQRNKTKLANKYSVRIDLTQLNIDEETERIFTEGAKEEVKKFLDNYERDL